MANKEIYTEPSQVGAEDGVVSVDGPDHVDVKLTPEAADETGERLQRQAVMAAGQRRTRKRG